MIGMLQILTDLLALYLVMKGIHILQVGLASSRQDRGLLIAIGLLSVVICCVGAYGFTSWQDQQAQSVGHSGFGVPR